MGGLATRFGGRVAVFLGALLIGAGMALSSRSQSVGQFYVLYALTGLGLGATWVVPVATVQRWFRRGRGFALGAVAAGVGIGALILAPSVNYLIESFSWRVAYLVVGLGLGALLVLAALATEDSPEKRGLTAYGEEKTPENPPPIASGSGRAVRSPAFLVVVLIYALNMFAWSIIIVHLVPYASDRGLDPTLGARALGLLAAVSVAGRIVGGALADRLGWREANFATGVLCGLLVAFLPWVASALMLVLFAVVYGFFYGGRIPTVTGLVAYIFGMRGLPELTGIAWGIGGLFGLLGPLTAGYLFDRLGSYTVAFLAAAFAFVVAGWLSLLARPSPGQAAPAPGKQRVR